jgi:hypothetical protein
MKKQSDWGWDSGLLRHRILKSLGLSEKLFSPNASIINILANADDHLDHLPFRISDVVLVTDKFPVAAELLNPVNKSTFWNKIRESDNLFLFCDPYRPVDSCVILASSVPWYSDSLSFHNERKTITTKLTTFNKRLNISAYACII